MRIDTLFTPSEISRINENDLKNSLCVVLDVLRATSVIVAALNHGAKAIIPAGSIEEALELKLKYPRALLAGERDGFKIPPSLTGGIEFDLGNSPREFSNENVAGKIIIATTTNGTRAIKSAEKAAQVLISSFLNLKATASRIASLNPANLLIVCSGTKDQPTSEDILAAGALVEALSDCRPDCSDSAIVARDFYRFHKDNLSSIASLSAHARKLLSHKELAADVPYCLQIDIFNLVAGVKEGFIVRVG